MYGSRSGYGNEEDHIRRQVIGKNMTRLCSKRVIFASLAIANLLIVGLYQGFSVKFSKDTTLRHGSPNMPDQGYLLNAVDTIRAIAGAVLPDTGGSYKQLDVHIDDSLFGHTGKTHNHVVPRNDSINIAIGGGMTSRNVRGLSSSTVGTLQFFTTLLPSFCRTASQGYHNHFYLGYDNNDAFFTHMANLEAFRKHMFTFCERHCPKASNYSLHFVQCTHSKRPAWAQNDAMFEAYLDDMDYYYRLNDDSDMVTKGWTEAFIKVLGDYNPSNVGVVGPKHKGGNMAIMTYDFTHKTHVDIFGFYYPRLFTDWWADDWVTKVYQPGRSTKLNTIHLTHTRRLGRRYKLVDRSTGRKLRGQLQEDRINLQRFITFRELLKNDSLPTADGGKVISMSLYGKDVNYTYGAIRNAQLAPVIYPGWKIRFYVVNQNDTDKQSVPTRILHKLKSLGAELAVITGNIKPNPKYWRYLVAGDNSVDEFLIRDTHARLSNREKTAVDKWLSSSAIFHIIKDHPKHADKSVVDGLWAAKRTEFVDLLGKPIQEILKLGDDVLNNVIWPAMKNKTFCHDSVSCAKHPECQPFPVLKRIKTRLGLQYVGQKFDAYMKPIGNDSAQLNSVPGAAKCVTD